MPLVTGECMRCHGRAIFNTGNLVKEAVETWMATTEFGECAAGGWHVEIGNKADYYTLDWSKSFETVDEAREYNRFMLEAKLNREHVESYLLH